MIKKGFKFGLLLQIAIGPICLFIFNESIKKGFLNGFIGVFAVVIVDALFILLSIIGISSFFQRREKILKYFSILVLTCFSIKMIIDAVKIGEIKIIESKNLDYTKTFLTALFLTASNPLTILFWAGVFSSKIVEEKFTKKDEMKFGLGAVLSSLFFLSLIVIIGQYTKSFLEIKYILILNIIVALFLLYFAIKLLVKK